MSDKGATRIAFAIALLALSIAFSGWFIGSVEKRKKDQYVNYCLKELDGRMEDVEHTCVGLWVNKIK